MEGFHGIYYQRNDRRKLRLQWIAQKHPSVHVWTTSHAQIRMPTEPKGIGIHEGQLVCLLKVAYIDALLSEVNTRFKI